MTDAAGESLLTPGDELPADLDWDAEVTVHQEGPEQEPDQDRQLVIQNLNWENALYYDGPDFEDLIVHQSTDTYHEKLDGHFLVAYQISNPRFDENGTLKADGKLHPAIEGLKSEYHTQFHETLMESTLCISLKSARTTAAIREYLNQ